MPLADTDWRQSASESPRVASGSCRYVGSRALSSERHVASIPSPVVDGAGGMVHGSVLVGDRVANASASRAANAASKRAAFAVAAFGRTRRSALLRGSGWRGCGSRRRRLGRQLVEAGERLASRSASNNSMRVMRPSVSEDPEQEERPLVGAAAGAVGAGVRPAHEERVGLQAEDVVDAHGDVVGELEQGAEVLQQRFRPARGPGPQRSGGRRPRWRARARWRSDRGRAVPHGRDRARRRRGAGALGAVGEELGVALVQAGDGVAEPVGGEDLGPPAPPCASTSIRRSSSLS